MNLLDPLFRSQAVEKVLSNRATLQGMLEFEAALARAEAVAIAQSEKLPRVEAHELVRIACQRARGARRDLRSVLVQDAIIKANLTEAELDRLFAPGNYLGVADQLIERVLASRSLPREQKKSRKRGVPCLSPN